MVCGYWFSSQTGTEIINKMFHLEMMIYSKNIPPLPLLLFTPLYVQVKFQASVH